MEVSHIVSLRADDVIRDSLRIDGSAYERVIFVPTDGYRGSKDPSSPIFHVSYRWFHDETDLRADEDLRMFRIRWFVILLVAAKEDHDVVFAKGPIDGR